MTYVDTFLKNCKKRSYTQLHNKLFEGVVGLKKQFPNIPEETLNKLLQLDPTYKGGDANGLFTKWIFKLYNNMLKDDIAMKKWEQGDKKFNAPARRSQDNPEDFEKLPELLTRFMELPKDSNVKLDAFNSIASLASFIEENSEKMISNSKISEMVQLFKKSISLGSKEEFNDKNWVVITTPTYECNHVFGQVTHWCTTSNEGHYFDMYLRDGGAYHIILNKQSGDIFQLHAPSNQIKDANDKELKSNQLKEMLVDNDFARFLISTAKEEEAYKMVRRFLQSSSEEIQQEFDFEQNDVSMYDDKVKALYKLLTEEIPYSEYEDVTLDECDSLIEEHYFDVYTDSEADEIADDLERETLNGSYSYNDWGDMIKSYYNRENEYRLLAYLNYSDIREELKDDYNENIQNLSDDGIGFEMGYEYEYDKTGQIGIYTFYDENGEEVNIEEKRDELEQVLIDNHETEIEEMDDIDLLRRYADEVASLLDNSSASDYFYVNDIINDDGRGSVISGYDGEEHWVRYEGEDYYIYRQG